MRCCDRNLPDLIMLPMHLGEPVGVMYDESNSGGVSGTGDASRTPKLFTLPKLDLKRYREECFKYSCMRAI